MGFIKWFMENLYSNCFTIVTVIVSGLISWIISATYYHIGNRTNLKVFVILPIAELLKDHDTCGNYSAFCKLSSEYSVKYLRKKEFETLMELKSAYKDIHSYNASYVNATILFSYFEDKLELNGVEWEPILNMTKDGEVECEAPDGWFELLYDLERHLNRYDLNFEIEECQKAVTSLFTRYCRRYISSKDIKYFDDINLDKVLAQSVLRAEWDQKLKTMQEAKERFLNLKIVRETLKKSKMLFTDT